MHVDFMMGCADMNIDGVYEDGERSRSSKLRTWSKSRHHFLKQNLAYCKTIVWLHLSTTITRKTQTDPVFWLPMSPQVTSIR